MAVNRPYKKTIMEGQKQMLECTKCKMRSVDIADARYKERAMKLESGEIVSWDEEQYKFYNSKPKKSGVHDWSRAKLNFEINTKTGEVQDIDYDKPSIKRRWDELMEKHHTATQTYHNPKTGKSVTKKRTIRKNEIRLVGTLMGGNRERLHEIAFDRPVKLGKDGLGQNGDVKRNKEVEEWALDCYRWACDTWGKENILTFVVHLDETNPHIHCDYVPLRDGKLSYTAVMHGENGKEEASAWLMHLHDDFAEKVGKKWGLERGDSISETGNRWKSMEEHIREVEMKEQAKRAIEKKLANLGKKLQQGKITEAEYEKKIAYHNAKLEKVLDELEKLTGTKKDLEEEVSLLSERRTAIQEDITIGQTEKESIRAEIGKLEDEKKTIQTKNDLLRGKSEVRTAVSAFVRPAFFEPTDESESRVRKFWRFYGASGADVQPDILSLLIEMVSCCVAFIDECLGTDNYRDRIDYVKEDTELDCSHVQPKDISRFPELREMSMGIVHEWTEMARRKDERNRMEALQEEAWDWIRGCSKSVAAHAYGLPILERHFMAGTLPDFIAAIRKIAARHNIVDKVEGFIGNCIMKTQLEGYVRSLNK